LQRIKRGLLVTAKTVGIDELQNLDLFVLGLKGKGACRRRGLAPFLT
jgi:hypothetical protein